MNCPKCGSTVIHPYIQQNDKSFLWKCHSCCWYWTDSDQHQALESQLTAAENKLINAESALRQIAEDPDIEQLRYCNVIGRGLNRFMDGKLAGLKRAAQTAQDYFKESKGRK
jgi:transposase-like protein